MILSVPFCPYQFVRNIFSPTIFYYNPLPHINEGRRPRRLPARRPVLIHINYFALDLVVHLRLRTTPPRGAPWSSKINAANGARGARYASRILPTVQRP